MNIRQSTLTSTKPTNTRSRRLLTGIILGSLSAFGPLSIDMYLPALPILTSDLHTSPSLAQFSLTACLLGLAFGQLVSGSQSDVRGRRIPLLIGLAFYTLSSLVCAMSPSIWGLIAFRFIQGVAGSAGIAISRAVVRDLYSGSDMIKFFALLMLINGIGPIMAPILGGQLLQFTSWRGVFLVLGIVGIVMLLSVFFALPETLPVLHRSQGGLRNTLNTFGKLICDRVFMGYAIPQGLVMAAMFAYISGSPFVIQNIFGASPQMYSVLFAINGIGIILAGQVTSRLASRIAGTKLFLGGLSMAAVGGISLLAVILVGSGLKAILLSLFVVVSSVGIVSTAGSSLAMENYGHSAGSASALLGLFSFVIGALVAPLVGLGGEYTAVPMGIVIAVAEIGAMSCYLILRPRLS
ncbi:drug resistance transporter, Bcr/CflA subfamily [Desulfosporosinus orientis DSM 765]|uniref:Bcr/CflA family efflux transporter n=1 Tax=Desulfosporosinus orientis (strain ATCC 19365 / DSM 765 / NCIMB 8382 / VKM B-1628 / Singapore I) TaxID=768706 RepID=G7WDP2_DESOD|nr:multidrug effflux MFS transporter [Desulfosporosinus orientis]AET68367.1 drug resistance transporter, Bcr/CflA subfamily [Desulfosporosinus orientis DSM 765]